MIEVLPGSQPPVKCVELRDHADYPLDFLLAGTDVDARDPHLAVCRNNSGSEHPDRGRLSGTIGSQQTEELAVLNLEVECIYCSRAARIDSGEAPRLDYQASLRGALLGRTVSPRLGRWHRSQASASRSSGI